MARQLPLRQTWRQSNIRNLVRSFARSAAQDLHRSISDAAAKRSGATKAEIAALSEKAKAVAQSAKPPSAQNKERRPAYDRSVRRSRGHASAPSET